MIRGAAATRQLQNRHPGHANVAGSRLGNIAYDIRGEVADAKGSGIDLGLTAGQLLIGGLNYRGGIQRDVDRAEPEVTAKAALRRLHSGAGPDTVSTSMAGPLGVLVIDDSPVPRFAARAMLGATQSFRCVGEASSGAEGVAACERLRPQVVLMDVDMPQMDGAQATRSILQLGDPQPIIVAWTVSDSGDDLIRMIHAGCHGYALKDFGPAELERSLLAAVKGETPVPRKMVRDVIAKAVSGRRAPGNDVEELTAREREVLHLVARGSATKEAAAQLGISRRSVDAHLRSIYRKLDATNRVQAVNRARAYGLIPFEQFDTD